MSPFDSTAQQLLQNAGGIFLGKNNMDEFAMGSNNTTSGLYPPALNPVFGAEEPRSSGGSSGGSAAAVSANMCDFSLGSDTGGSTRLPAAYCGVVGYKPTYGLLSRYGIVPYANTLDTVGIVARDVETTRKVFNTLNKYDSKDKYSLPQDLRNRIKQHTEAQTEQEDKDEEPKEKKKYTIGIVHETNIDDIDEDVRNAWIESLEYLHSLGHEIVTVSVPSTSLSLSTYFIISPLEHTLNLVKYQKTTPAEAMKDCEAHIFNAAIESKQFCAEFQRRTLLGTFNLNANATSHHVEKAQQVRRKLQLEYDAVFEFPNLAEPENATKYVGYIAPPPKKVDVLISPTTRTIAPSHEELLNAGKAEGIDAYINDVLTVPANIAGLPAISVPWGKGKKTVGIQVSGQFGDDNTVLDIASILETHNASN